MEFLEVGGLLPESKISHHHDVVPPKPLASWYAQGLSDGLGDRLLMFDNSGAPSLELLRFHPHLAQVPGFETALRERVQRLGQFRHPAFAQVRSVKHLEPDDDLALISNCTPGKRLSEVLHRAHGPAFAAAAIRQLAPALALLQQHDVGISHGVLSPDRIIVSPEGRLTIVEHVLGPAIDTLNLRTHQLASMGIPVPPATASSAPHLNASTDWYQLGLVALAVLIGRPVTPSELPQLERVLDLAVQSAPGGGSGLSPSVREWLERALQISGNRIESGADGRAAFDELLQKERPRDSRPLETAPTLIERVPAPAPVTAARAPVTAATAPITATPAPVPVVSAPATPRLSPFELAAAQRATQERSSPITSWRMGVRTGGVKVRTLLGQSPTAAKGTRVDSAQQKQADPRVVVRRRISIPLAVLAVIAGVEAGAIARLSRALLVAPHPAISVDSTPAVDSGLVVSSHSTDAPLRLTVAPDLRWVRVSSVSSTGGDAKAATTRVGTIRISSPIELKVFEGSRLLGSVPGGGLNLAAGQHDLELVNVALGYRLRQSLHVQPGETVSIHVVPAKLR